VRKEGGRITEITMEDGNVFRAKMFIDASYEGDLMAKAGVSYHVGREANSVYGETLNGVRAHTPLHQFKVAVDPFVRPGEPSSGLLPFIQADDGGKPGEGDRLVQTYNYRLCFTTNAVNRMPVTPPANYQPTRYELLARYLEALGAAQYRAGQFKHAIDALRLDRLVPGRGTADANPLPWSRVESVDQLKQDVDELVGVNPVMNPIPVGKGKEGGARLERHADHDAEDRQRAEGVVVLRAEDVLPGDALVGGLPDAARCGADVQDGRILRVDLQIVDASARGRGADVAEMQRVEGSERRPSRLRGAGPPAASPGLGCGRTGRAAWPGRHSRPSWSGTGRNRVARWMSPDSLTQEFHGSHRLAR
jgi:hypothetical protein